MQFKLILQQARTSGQPIRPNYAVLIALLVLGFLIVFAVLSIMGGVLAAMFYSPIFLGAAALLLLLMIFGKPQTAGAAKQEVRLDEQGITAGFPPFRLPVSWDHIRDVQLRFGVLTITFRDDVSHQYPVAPFDFEADELELFAAAQILKAKGLPLARPM